MPETKNTAQQDAVRNYYSSIGLPFSDEQAFAISNEADDSFLESIGKYGAQLGTGIAQGFSTIEVGPAPENTAQAIVRNIGELMGFVGFLPVGGGTGRIVSGVVGKILGRTIAVRAGISASKFGLQLKSVPMAVSDVVLGIAKKSGVSAGASKIATQFLHMGPRSLDVVEGGLKLGIMSATSAAQPWEVEVDKRFQGFINGMAAGAAFRSIGNVFAKHGYWNLGEEKIFGALNNNDIARILSSSMVMGVPSTVSGAPLELQVYDYLLGAYFGKAEMDAHSRSALQFMSDFNKTPSDRSLMIKVPFKDPQSPREREFLNRYTELSPQAQEDVQIQSELNYGRMLDPTAGTSGGRIFGSVWKAGILEAEQKGLVSVKDIRSLELAQEIETRAERYVQGGLDINSAHDRVREEISTEVRAESQELETLRAEVNKKKAGAVEKLIELHLRTALPKGYWAIQDALGEYGVPVQFVDPLKGLVNEIERANLLSNKRGYEYTVDLVKLMSEHFRGEGYDGFDSFIKAVNNKFGLEINESAPAYATMRQVFTRYKFLQPRTEWIVGEDGSTLKKAWEIDRSGRMKVVLAAPSFVEDLTKNPVYISEVATKTGQVPLHTYVKTQVETQGLGNIKELTYEVSSAGDKRFSAFYAKLPDGRTIESAYQQAKGSGKGRASSDPNFEYWKIYAGLWREWANANPKLLAELAVKAKGRRLSDKFAKTENNQARALEMLLDERHAGWRDGGKGDKMSVMEDSDRKVDSFFASMVISMDADGKFIIGGVKAKNLIVGVDYLLNDIGGGKFTLKGTDKEFDLNKFLEWAENAPKDVDLGPGSKKVYQDRLNRFIETSGLEKSAAESIFRRNYANEMVLLQESNGVPLETILSNPGKFITDVSTLNKRMQLFNTGEPRWDTAFYKDIKGVENGNLKVVFLDDAKSRAPDGPPTYYAFNKKGEVVKLEHDAQTDGAIILRDDVFDAMLRMSGKAVSDGSQKGVLVFKEENVGLILGKYAYHRAGEELSKHMEDNDLHVHFYTSAAKQMGLRESVGYVPKLGENGQIEHLYTSGLTSTEKSFIYKIPTSSFTMNMSSGDHTASAYANQRALLQLLYRPDLLADGGEAALKAIDEEIQGPAWYGVAKDNALVKAYHTTATELQRRGMDPKDVARLEKMVEAVDVDNLSAQSIYDIVFGRATPRTRLYEKVIKHIWKRSSEDSDELLPEGYSNTEEQQWDAEWQRPSSSSERLFDTGVITPATMRTVHTRKQTEAKVMRYLIDRVRRPIMKGSFKLVAIPWSADRQLRYSLNPGEYYLTKEAENRIKIETHEGELTIGQVWAKAKVSPEKWSEYLEHIIVRAPMDSASGARVMRFKGFIEGLRGNGIMLHPEDMKSMGGMDLDIDSVFGYTKVPKALKEFYRKHQNEWVTKSSGKETTVTEQPVPLVKIISGGQTGADRAGLEAGKALGLKTGGWAPKGYRISDGTRSGSRSDPSLKEFGVREHGSEGYRERTIDNVTDADGTVWFGNPDSPGGRLTLSTARGQKSPLLINPSAQDLANWLVKKNIKTLNVAGNREHTNPGIGEKTNSVIQEAFKLKGRIEKTVDMPGEVLVVEESKNDPRFVLPETSAYNGKDHPLAMGDPILRLRMSMSAASGNDMLGYSLNHSRRVLASMWLTENFNPETVREIRKMAREAVNRGADSASEPPLKGWKEINALMTEVGLGVPMEEQGGRDYRRGETGSAMSVLGKIDKYIRGYGFNEDGTRVPFTIDERFAGIADNFALLKSKGGIRDKDALIFNAHYNSAKYFTDLWTNIRTLDAFPWRIGVLGKNYGKVEELFVKLFNDPTNKLAQIARRVTGRKAIYFGNQAKGFHIWNQHTWLSSKFAHLLLEPDKWSRSGELNDLISQDTFDKTSGVNVMRLGQIALKAGYSIERLEEIQTKIEEFKEWNNELVTQKRKLKKVGSYMSKKEHGFKALDMELRKYMSGLKDEERYYAEGLMLSSLYRQESSLRASLNAYQGSIDVLQAGIEESTMLVAEAKSAFEKTEGLEKEAARLVFESTSKAHADKVAALNGMLSKLKAKKSFWFRTNHSPFGLLSEVVSDKSVQDMMKIYSDVVDLTWKPVVKEKDIKQLFGWAKYEKASPLLAKTVLETNGVEADDLHTLPIVEAYVRESVEKLAGRMGDPDLSNPKFKKMHDDLKDAFLKYPVLFRNFPALFEHQYHVAVDKASLVDMQHFVDSLNRLRIGKMPSARAAQLLFPDWVGEKTMPFDMRVIDVGMGPVLGERPEWRPVKEMTSGMGYLQKVINLLKNAQDAHRNRVEDWLKEKHNLYNQLGEDAQTLYQAATIARESKLYYEGKGSNLHFKYAEAESKERLGKLRLKRGKFTVRMPNGKMENLTVDETINEFVKIQTSLAKDAQKLISDPETENRHFVLDEAGEIDLNATERHLYRYINENPADVPNLSTEGSFKLATVRKIDRTVVTGKLLRDNGLTSFPENVMVTIGKLPREMRRTVIQTLQDVPGYKWMLARKGIGRDLFPVENYFPHNGHPKKIMEEQLDFKLRELRDGKEASDMALLEEELNSRIESGGNRLPDAGYGQELLDFLSSREVTDDMMSTAGLMVLPGHLKYRGQEAAGGYDMSPNAWSRYFRQLINAQYNSAIGLFGHEIIDSFRKRVPLGEKTEDFARYMENFLRVNMGLPSTYPKEWSKGKDHVAPMMPYSIFSDKSWSRLLRKFDRKHFGSVAREKLLKDYTEIELKKDPSITSEKIGEEFERKFDALAERYFSRLTASASILDAKWSMMSLLSHTKTMVNNLFTANINIVASVGLEPSIKARNINFIRTHIDPKIQTKGDLEKTIAGKGGFETFIRSQMNYETSLPSNIQGAIGDIMEKSKKLGGPIDKTSYREILVKNNVTQAFFEKTAWFMRYSEIAARQNAWMAHYIKWRGVLEGNGFTFEDPWHPWLTRMANKGVEATQFLYNTANRPLFSSTNVGKIYSRFQLWAWNSARFRWMIYKEAQAYGFAEGTQEYERFKRMATADVFVMALASVFPASMFSASLSEPWNMMSQLSAWIFGDDETRDKAFRGTMPYPYNILNTVMPAPAVTRTIYPVFGSMVTGDWDRFLSYNLWTWFPFGRLGPDVIKTLKNPYMVLENSIGLPIHQLQGKLAKKYRPIRSKGVRGLVGGWAEE